jgi:hypothetical protein
MRTSVFVPGDDGVLALHRLPSLSNADVADLSQSIVAHVLAFLERRGLGCDACISGILWDGYAVRAAANADCFGFFPSGSKANICVARLPGFVELARARANIEAADSATHLPANVLPLLQTSAQIVDLVEGRLGAVAGPIRQIRDLQRIGTFLRNPRSIHATTRFERVAVGVLGLASLRARIRELDRRGPYERGQSFVFARVLRAKIHAPPLRRASDPAA